MRTVRIEVPQILELLGKQLHKVDGLVDGAYIDNLADACNVNERTLDWIVPTKANKQGIAEASKARVILVDDEVRYSEAMASLGKILLHVDNPKLALAKVGNKWFVNKLASGIHPTSIICENAQIGKNVYIGPHCFIESCVIGDNCVIDANVHIYDDVTIGHDCVIKSGAVIGGEGFGFERDENGNRFRFPQIGDVKIGDYVEIGANTCIDRGALSSTVIGDYTKINNMCHIAHNNVIGRNVVIAAEVNVSGGNVIEDNVWVAPNASLRGYVRIGEGATIGMGAVVVKDIPSGEVWVGNPAKKLEK